MIFQISGTHGYHIAMTESEAKANEENGWKTVTEAEFYKRDSVPRETLEESQPEDDEEIPRAVLVDLYKSKFGKKPHGRMTDESIKEKLEA